MQLKQLENVAMWCIATWGEMMLCLNWDACVKFLLLICALTICSVWAMTLSNSVPNLSKIIQSAAELWRLQYLT